MKKLLTLFIIFASFMMQGQNLPAETYRVDRVTFENNTRYKISVEQNPCLELTTVLDTEYFQFSRRTGLHTTATSTLRISESSDFSEGISYVIDGSYFGTERPRFNLSNIPYAWGTSRITSLAVDTARPLTARYDENLCEVPSHDITGFDIGTHVNPGVSRYLISYNQYVESGVRMALEFYDDITGELIFETVRTVNANSATSEFNAGVIDVSVHKAPVGTRHRIEVRVTGAGDPSEATFYGRVNVKDNIVVTDISRRHITFRVMSEDNNRNDRINVSGREKFGAPIRHDSFNGWRRMESRSLAGGYVKEYTYRYGNRWIESYETARVSAWRDGEQGEYTPVFQLNGPTPDLQVRIERDRTSSVRDAAYRVVAEWELIALPPGWTEDQIIGIESSIYSEERITASINWRFVRYSNSGLIVNERRGRRLRGEQYNDNFWRFTDNDWEFTLRFIRQIDGRLDAYTIRYKTDDEDGTFQPNPGDHSERSWQYGGGSHTRSGSYRFSGAASQWHDPTFPTSLFQGQRSAN